MDRRTFVKSTALASLATCTPGNKNPVHKQPKFKMGYQLYSIRDEMEKDPIATLKALKQMGYQDFELYGYDHEQDKYYGFKSADFKKILDDLELTVTSGHYGLAPFHDRPDEELRKYVDYCIRGARTIDSAYITWPFVNPEHRNIDGFKLLSHKMNLIGEQVNKAGLGFAYHNHGYEYDEYNGQSGYGVMINETDADLVRFQMDMYWVRYSSDYTPQQLIDEQPGRYVMWHIKDMDKVTRDYTELGNGSIDYLSLLPDPVTSGLEYYYIEQGGNYTVNSMKSAETSAVYCKKHLQEFL